MYIILSDEDDKNNSVSTMYVCVILKIKQTYFNNSIQYSIRHIKFMPSALISKRKKLHFSEKYYTGNGFSETYCQVFKVLCNFLKLVIYFF